MGQSFQIFRQYWNDKQKDAIRMHNLMVLKSFKKGDLIEMKRNCWYSHWAMYIGEETVFHLTGDRERIDSQPLHCFSIAVVRFDKAKVQKDNFWTAVGNSKAYKNNKKDDKYEIRREIGTMISAAHATEGRLQYNALLNNCEHFVTEWRYEKKKSEQAQNAGYYIGAAALVFAVGAAAYIRRTGVIAY